MTKTKTTPLKLPKAPPSIVKGGSLKSLLDHRAINCLAHNLAVVQPSFDKGGFKKSALSGLEELEILQRGHHLSHILFQYLPKPYSKAVTVLLRSLTPAHTKTEKLGLGVFFYLPHVSFVSNYGLDLDANAGRDPFEISMEAQYELTRRFSAEFSIRRFLIEEQKRTLTRLKEWTDDPCPHVRGLCSEGTRPRLPWATRIPSLVKDPRPCLNILETLKDDPSLYVRRSVANHIGDIAKDHPDLAIRLCKTWLKDASPERKWLIRHALRYLAKKNNPAALKIRVAAK